MHALFGEAPQNRTAEWHSGQDRRGSFNILSSCIITLGLCIWTAVHLNLPPYEAHRNFKFWDPRRWLKRQLIWKCGWLVIGLLAPEMVGVPDRNVKQLLMAASQIAFTAWVQRRDAHALTKKVNDALKGHGVWDPKQTSSSIPNIPEDIEHGAVNKNEKARNDNIEPDADEEGPTLIPRKFEWTHVHSFMAVMGGFVVDTTELDEDEQYLPGSRTRITLAPNGVHGLAKYAPETLPDVSIEDIRDKSKADTLAKFIVCVQAIWFCIQIVVRMAQHLPISLLELNTFAHALCALLIYCLWWDKPLDIEQPFIIRQEKAHDVCALFCYCSEFEPAMDSQRVEFVLRERNTNLSPAINPTLRREKLREWRSEIQEADGDSGWLGVGGHVPGTAPGTRARTKSDLYMSDKNFSRWLARTRKFTQRDRNRWNMAYLTSQRCNLAKYTAPYVVGLPSWVHQKEISFESGARDRMRNLPVDFPYDEAMQLFPDRSKLHDALGFLFAFTVAGLMYGGLHLLAWNAPFTNRIQELLWKISGLAVISSGLSLFSLIVLAYGEEKLRKRAKRRSSASFTKRLHWVMLKFLQVLVISFALFYLCARVYLVVECFISFAYLPDGVFQDAKWSAYFPHIQ
jgi:hypothetical protein